MQSRAADVNLTEIKINEEQHPVLLWCKDSNFTRLVIWDAHESTMHHGVESTLARVRARYWIVKGRNRQRQGHFTEVCLVQTISG
jgi:hypothetical protein